MPWPKGKLRKGHVNKDGSPHRSRSTYRLAKEVILREMPSMRTSIATSETGPIEHPSQRMTASTLNKGKALTVSGETPTTRGATTSRAPKVASTDIPKGTVKVHGHTGRPVIEPCPKCGFAYADGGYCDECGWSAPVVIGRVY